MPRLLLVDDDPYLMQALRKLFQREGYHCTTAATAGEARRLLTRPAPEEPFDLLLLDVGLPDLDGLTLLRQLRERSHLPVLLLTARSGASDKIVGLEVGADDYLAKPFDPGELLAQVRALLRRATEYNAAPETRRELRAGPLVVDAEAREARIDGRSIHLTEREFELLHLLIRHAGKALSSEWIFESVWGCDADFGLKTLTVHVQRLRRKIEADSGDPRLLVTVRGYGYKLCG